MLGRAGGGVPPVRATRGLTPAPGGARLPPLPPSNASRARGGRRSGKGPGGEAGRPAQGGGGKATGKGHNPHRPQQRRRTLTPSGCDLPRKVHDKLEPRGRTILVGDVHGCYDEMLLLLDRQRFDPGRDTLIFLGDLVAKGPHSNKVLTAARELGAFSIRGNNDDAALRAFAKLSAGLAVKPKYNWVHDMDPRDAAWLKELPFSLTLDRYRTILVHAGIVPGRSVRKQRLIDLYKMRNVFRQDAVNEREERVTTWQAVPKETGKDGVPWAETYRGPHHIFFGHDAIRSLQLHDFATGLDTGCVYGGKLSAAVLPDIPEPIPETRPGVTLETLGAKIVQINSFRVHFNPTPGQFGHGQAERPSGRRVN